jgi:hypothetical protein
MPQLKEPGAVQAFISAEEKIRGGKLLLEEINAAGLDTYWADLLQVIFYFNSKKNGGQQQLLEQVKTRTAYARLL